MDFKRYKIIFTKIHERSLGCPNGKLWEKQSGNGGFCERISRIIFKEDYLNLNTKNLLFHKKGIEFRCLPKVN